MATANPESRSGSELGPLEFLSKGLQSGDPTVLGVVVALTVVFLTLVVLFLKSRGKNNRQGVLLLGICDSGKTLIYSQLMHKGFKQTYTSIQTNSGDLPVPEKNKKLRLIDLPGHVRIRGQLIEQYKGLARGVVFVVDSGTLQKEVKEVAEYLYTILSDRAISGNAPPILILCNKQDLTLAKGAKVVRSLLEKEINTLRITRTAALQGVGEMANNNSFLGKRDKDFSFSDLKPLRIDFAECSAFGGDKNADEPQLEDLHKWLVKIA